MTRYPYSWLRPAWILAAHLGLCALMRGVLAVAWPQEFAELAALDLLRAQAHGMVFDASIVVMGLAPALLVFMLPSTSAQMRHARALAAWYAFAHFALLALVLVVDVHYFGTVGRHLGAEALAIVDDPALVWGMVREGYALSAALLALGLAASAWAWRRMLAWDEARDVARAPVWVPLSSAALCVLLARGGWSGKPINVVDAFSSGSLPRGYLTMNGAFSLAHGLGHDPMRARSSMDASACLAVVRADLADPGERWLDERYPLMRARDARDAADLNVLVLLLESWDGDVVDAIRAARGLEPLGLTPNVDRLAARGVLLTQCYAAGQRSTHGLLAVLAGLPSLPGFPYLGRGIEQSEAGYLGRMARAEGHRTFLMQGSAEHSFRLDSIAALAGFDSYSGMHTIAAARHVQPMAKWGVWDGDLLDHAADEAARGGAPFTGVVFTTSTHLPYQWPADFAPPYATDAERHRFWNSIAYVDRELGRFVERGERDGWLARTVLVLVADHCSPLKIAGSSGAARHDIFALIVAPGLAARVERRVASQLDILPTIAHLAHWSAPHAAFGRSLADEHALQRGAALCVRGEVVTRIENDGRVEHDLTRRLRASAGTPPAVLDQIERRLLASVDVVAELLSSNRVFQSAAAESR